MNTTIKFAILSAISESWSGDPVPHPYENEFVRGQFELALHLLGFGGKETEDAFEDLYADLLDVHEGK